jgi:hypothetical protein
MASSGERDGLDEPVGIDKFLLQTVAIYLKHVGALLPLHVAPRCRLPLWSPGIHHCQSFRGEIEGGGSRCSIEGIFCAYLLM